MKFSIVFALSFFFTLFGFSQKVSVKLFTGVDNLNHSRLLWAPSEIDSNRYFISSELDDAFFLRPAISFEFKNKNLFEISGFINRREFRQAGITNDTSLFGINTLTNIGETLSEYYELQFDHFWNFEHLKGERLSTYWGIGIRGYFDNQKFTPFTNSSIYPLRTRKTAVVLNLNTRLHWEFFNPAWQVQGVFGIQVVDIGLVENFVGDPNFTLAQQNHSLFNLDGILNAFWKMGISYTFGLKPPEENK